MNVELARASLAAARAYRDRFSMAAWFSNADPNGYEIPSAVINDDNRVPPCGTVGCYAGFVTFATAPKGTVIANGGRLYRSMVQAKRDEDRYEGGFGHAQEYARRKLRISEDQSRVLFFLNDLEEVERAVNILADNPDISRSGLAEALGLDPEDY